MCAPTTKPRGRSYQLRRTETATLLAPLREHAAQVAGIAQAAYTQAGTDLLRLLDAPACAPRRRRGVGPGHGRLPPEHRHARSGGRDTPMITRRLACAFLVTMLTACGRAETTDTAPRTSGSPPRRSEITLSAAQQAEAMISTAPVTATDEPERLHATGRIALADTRTWRVGVRTDGLVSTVTVGVGDLVRKGQLLARYHADELPRYAGEILAGAHRSGTRAGRDCWRSATLSGRNCCSS